MFCRSGHIKPVAVGKLVDDVLVVDSEDDVVGIDAGVVGRPGIAVAAAIDADEVLMLDPEELLSFLLAYLYSRVLSNGAEN